MEYLCVKCQKKHPITSISADIWTIFSEDIEVGLAKLIEEYEASSESNDIFKMDALAALQGGSAQDSDDIFTELLKWTRQSGRSGFFVSGSEYEEEFEISRDDDLKFSPKLKKSFALNHKNYKSRVKIDKTMVKSDAETIIGTFTIKLKEFIDIFDTCFGEEMFTPQRREALEKVSPEFLEKPVLEKKVIITFVNGAFTKILNEDSSPIRRGDVKSKTVENLSYRRVCSECGIELSRVAGTAREIVVGLAGSARVGKTATIIATIASLLDKNNPIDTMDVNFDPHWERMKSMVDDYNKGYKVEKTETDQSVAKYYSIPVDVPGDTDCVLTLVDMPGEFWTTESGENGMSDEFFRDFKGIFTNLDSLWLAISKATVITSAMEFDMITDEQRKNIEERKQKMLEEQRAGQEVKIESNEKYVPLKINFGRDRD